MSKRKEAFLQKRTRLNKFTLNSLSHIYSFTNEEIQQMIDNGFIEMQIQFQCENCNRDYQKKPNYCDICGNEEFTEHGLYYKYKEKD